LLKDEGVYVRLLQLFAEADERYNSGIFHFQKERERKELPDSLTTALIIDDGTLKDIIQDLYFPDSPYVFSEIPAEILGQEKNQSTISPEVLRLLPAAPEQRDDRRARKIHARAAQASLPIFKAGGNEWRLTTTERKRIL